MRTDCTNPGECLHRGVHRSNWCGACVRYVDGLTRPEPPPKFKPGDPVIVYDKSELRHGQMVWLAERRFGLIAGRPYWIARETPEGYPHLAIPEDSLKPETIREPVIARPEIKKDVRVKLLPPHPHAGDEVTLVNVPTDKGMMCFFEWDDGHYAYANRSEMEALPIATIVDKPTPEPTPFARRYAECVERRADPRPEAKADSPQDHDGQANTSGEKADRVVFFGGFQVKREAELSALADLRGRSILDHIKPERSIAAVLLGVEHWRRQGTKPRLVNICLTGDGHAELHVVVASSMHPCRATFNGAYTAEEVIVALDEFVGVWAALPEAQITMNGAKFSEDTGEIKP